MCDSGGVGGVKETMSPPTPRRHLGDEGAREADVPLQLLGAEGRLQHLRLRPVAVQNVLQHEEKKKGE